MHQGLTAKILICSLCVGLFLASPISAQLNSSDEIIQTIDDIQIQDDGGAKKEENPNKPQYDEEFSRDESQAIEEEFGDEVAEPKEVTPREERKSVEQKKEEPSYEEELEKNADKNKLDRREIFPEDMKNFEVDPVQQAQPAPPPEIEKAPVVKSPRRETPKDPEQEIEEEISAMPENVPEDQAPVVEEAPGEPIRYEPEPTGPVIVYENEKKLTKEERKSLSERTKVEIEDDPFIEGTLTKDVRDYLKPFKERRPTWTRQFELGVAQYTPVNYYSDIVDSTNSLYEDYYEADMPMPTLAFEFKRNFSFGGIALGGAVSYYTASGISDDGTMTSDIEVIAPSIKLSLYLDTIFNEPYLVPYGSFGYSYMMYNETATNGSDLEYSGETDSFFFALGAQFQLDWLDRDADASSFDMGIENTFIFLEARQYLDAGIIGYDDYEAGTGVSADFSAPFFVSGGIKMEF